ncbi:hypothetical protein BSR28_01410 [Boudabousia liubingyangii]|uniref:hypothetical protein n=1 Tax=Boudabousia liubingyangii TaxID=1921764 RepID=UPI00093AF8C2|nr:hypothetical protein [Boudabousia liubingyangii]OKL48387.1 hypothetical protein BSR28_01410 [Boudabousia liubingyangii]
MKKLASILALSALAVGSLTACSSAEEKSDLKACQPYHESAVKMAKAASDLKTEEDRNNFIAIIKQMKADATQGAKLAENPKLKTKFQNLDKPLDQIIENLKKNDLDKVEKIMLGIDDPWEICAPLILKQNK